MTKYPTPNDNRIAVLLDEEPEQTGLIQVQYEHVEKPSSGTVVAVGPGTLDPEFGYIGLPFTLGQKVWFGKYAGLAIDIDEQEIVFLRYDEVIAYE
jgi:chaperonin GroES